MSVAVPSDAAAESVVEKDAVVEKKRRPVEAPAEPRHLPRYAVVVENDEFHSFPYVIEVLRKTCGHDRRRAYQLTNQVHFRGQAAVWTGPLEHAELKRDLIREFGPDHFASEPVTFPLGVRLEPLAEG